MNLFFFSVGDSEPVPNAKQNLTLLSKADFTNVVNVHERN